MYYTNTFLQLYSLLNFTIGIVSIVIAEKIIRKYEEKHSFYITYEEE